MAELPRQHHPNHTHRTMIDLLLYSFAYLEERAYRTFRFSLFPAFESAYLAFKYCKLIAS
jgi:hypothetical protein